MKVKEYLKEAIDKSKLMKYKLEYKEQRDKFYSTPEFSENRFRCMHLKNKPTMAKEQCIKRAEQPKLYKDCKGCPKFNKLTK